MRTVRHAPTMALSLLFGIGCLTRDGSSDEPTGASANTEVEAHVTVFSTPAGLGARFELGEPVRAVSFADAEGVNRESWTVVTAGVSLAGAVVTGLEPFSVFEVAIAVDPREHDRVYPSLHRVADGYVLYGPALALEGLPLRVDVKLEAGQQLAPAAEPERGYFYLGPDSARVGPGFTLTSGPELPELSEALFGAFENSLRYYTQWLSDVPTRPTVFVSTRANLPDGYRGDVAGGGTVSFRFGDLHRAEQVEALEPWLSRFVHHEVFHLWNATVAAENVAWLHEGGAEYAAIVAIASQQQLTQADALQQLSQMGNRCREALGEEKLHGARLRGQDIYACGVFVQWLADLEARARSDGKEHVFTIWAGLCDDAVASSEDAVQRFVSVVGPVTRLVLDESGAQRWSRVVEGLEALGVQIDDTPSHDSYRSAMVLHLLEFNCAANTPHGFWPQPDGVKLDAPESCGSLAGNPEVVAVESHDLVADADRAFDAVREACDRGQGVRLQLRSGEEIVARCESPPSTPVGLAITAAPLLAIE